MTRFALYASDEARERAIKRQEPRPCGCPPRLMCACSEDNPNGHLCACPLWGKETNA